MPDDIISIRKCTNCEFFKCEYGIEEKRISCRADGKTRRQSKFIKNYRSSNDCDLHIKRNSGRRVCPDCDNTKIRESAKHCIICGKELPEIESVTEA